MVLELLTNPKIERSHKSKFFFVGALYTFIACGLAMFLFPSHASVVSVFLIVLSIAPFMYHMLEREEIKELRIHTNTKLFAEYWNIIYVLLFLFAGMVIAYATLFAVFPESILFTYQSAQFENKVVPALGHFEGIFVNNLIVLLVCILFSFFFGFGAIFVIALNASIVGTGVGLGIISAIQTGSVLQGFLSVFQYVPHGVLEISAYFVAGIAGSFLSFGIIHKEYLNHKFQSTISHVVLLFLLSLILLILGSFVEVTIFPLFFA